MASRLPSTHQPLPTTAAIITASVTSTAGAMRGRVTAIIPVYSPQCG